MTTIQVNQQCFCDREAERLSVCLAEKRGPQPTRRECGSPIDNPNFGECIRNSVDRRISYHQECIEEENIQSSPRRPSEARGLASSDDIIDKTTIVAASSGSKVWKKAKLKKSKGADGRRTPNTRQHVGGASRATQMRRSDTMHLHKRTIQISSSKANGGSVFAANEAAEVRVEKPLSKRQYRHTLELSQMPLWIADNRFILSGYRQICNSYSDCLLSLFYLHNEFVNIYSHGIGVIFCILWWTLDEYSKYASTTTSDRLALFCFLLGSAICMGCSTLFHLFCCHSQECSMKFQKLDYLGICGIIIGSFVPIAYYGFYCNFAMQAIYISVMTIGCAVTIFLSVSSIFVDPRYRNLRIGSFMAFYAMGAFPLIHLFSIYPVDFVTKAVSFFALMKMTAILLVAVIFYAMRLPERFFPGTFDIFGHSHQIWHILIFISVLALLLRLTIQIYVNYLGVIDSHAFWKLENPQCRIPISQML
ncbi:MAG: hypothetical protein SGCHY_001052 [Lobulomycetales sp.]